MAYREGTLGRAAGARTVLSVTAGLLAAALAGTWAPSATAQDGSDRAAAQALYDEARKLIADNKYAEACPKLEESQKLDPGFGTAFYLADCWQHVGKVASAWALYLDVAAGTKAAGQLDRATLARTRAAALEGKLSRLTITVADPAPGIRVERDGDPVGRALWGTAVPVDPGEHHITARADAKKDFEKTITVAGDGASESVTVPALEAAPVARKETSPVEASPTGAPEADRGVPTKKGLSHEGQLGTFLRADGAGIAFAKKVNGSVIAPSPALGVSYGLAPFLDVSLGAILGDSKGVEPSGTFFILPGMVKPRATLAVPVLFVDGARGGIRGAVGVEWDTSRNFGAFLDLGAAHFFSMPSGYDKFSLVPTVGISARM